MKFLHNDYELFQEVISSTANSLSRPVSIVEKDYYVTMILKQLTLTAPECVFKGGTSLSKCHHVIDRFSEDIDITFMSKQTDGQRRNFKNKVVRGIGEELGLPIVDWDKAGSGRLFNVYTFSYVPIDGQFPDGMNQGVRMEVVQSSISFPNTKLFVDSYVYQFLKNDNFEIVQEYDLEPFEMTVQCIERTLIDKVFAICDYFLKAKETGEEEKRRHSRHIYDIHLLLQRVVLNGEFRELVKEVRTHRASMNTCLSAKDGVDVPMLLREIIDSKAYYDDYESITKFFLKDSLEYDVVIASLEAIIGSGMFAA